MAELTEGALHLIPVGYQYAGRALCEKEDSYGYVFRFRLMDAEGQEILHHPGAFDLPVPAEVLRDRTGDGLGQGIAEPVIRRRRIYSFRRRFPVSLDRRETDPYNEGKRWVERAFRGGVLA